jgi:hypothetical protein
MVHDPLWQKTGHLPNGRHGRSAQPQSDTGDHNHLGKVLDELHERVGREEPFESLEQRNSGELGLDTVARDHGVSLDDHAEDRRQKHDDHRGRKDLHGP